MRTSLSPRLRCILCRIKEYERSNVHTNCCCCAVGIDRLGSERRIVSRKKIFRKAMYFQPGALSRLLQNKTSTSAQKSREVALLRVSVARSQWYEHGLISTIKSKNSYRVQLAIIAKHNRSLRCRLIVEGVQRSSTTSQLVEGIFKALKEKVFLLQLCARRDDKVNNDSWSSLTSQVNTSVGTLQEQCRQQLSVEWHTCASAKVALCNVQRGGYYFRC